MNNVRKRKSVVTSRHVVEEFGVKGVILYSVRGETASPNNLSDPHSSD